MKTRYIPFGYCLSDGIIIAHDIEAEMVKLTFRQYIAGDSYSRIAALLEKMGCPYNEGTTLWNKNMVGRILKNRNISDKDGYPTLVTEEKFTQSICCSKQSILVRTFGQHRR